MAEARSEEEEENMRDAREQVVRRQPSSSGGRPDRRKPEHRHSQGPLSSIRAAIKRTSTRSTSLSETSRERDRERERDRDRERDRRRPEITIVSAEPLASTSWFPGASGGFPPPPPPAAQIWGPTIPPSIQPPPSYEEVIREKTQEQVLLPPPPPPPPSSSSGSSSSLHRISTTTIATQTDPNSAPDSREPQVTGPVRPPRPPFPYPHVSAHTDDITASQSTLTSLNGDSVGTNTEPAHAQCCDLLTDICSPFTADDSVAPPTALRSERPRPRPRSKFGIRPIGHREVEVQTLVKLREDGLATLAARTGANNNTTAVVNQEVSQGKYLQELLEAFSADDWGFPDRHSDSSGHSQSESEDEDMATLKARIQAFEQQQQVADGSCGDGDNRDFAVAKNPEPRPRPRLQGQPAKSSPPVVAPKPKNFSQAQKPSSKGFWEDGGEDSVGADTALSDDPNPEPEPPALKPAAAVEPLPLKPDKPAVAPKPQPIAETAAPSGVSSPASAPVPAPRPPPPNVTRSPRDAPNPKPPPRPPVAPRASTGPAPQERSNAAGRTTPTLPPRPSVEVGSGAQDAENQTVKVGSVRPGVPTKPAALTSLRRASAPNLAPKPIGASLTPPDPNPVACKPPEPTVVAVPVKPPVPAPALRRSSVNPNPSDPPLPPRPSSVKLLPLRPPPIKSNPGRPPPPSVNSTSSVNQTPPQHQPPRPPCGATPSPSEPSAGRSTPPPPITSLSATANQLQAQRIAKRGPPLPPRPKPGHPLFSYVKQEVLIVLDDAPPSVLPSGEGKSRTTAAPLISQSLCLLDSDTQPKPVPDDQENPSKPPLEDLRLSESQSILPVQPPEQKEQPEPPPVSGPRCTALFDYEGEEEDELTFCQGDIIALLELVGQEWGRGQIHGRVGIFPLSFTEVAEPLPSPGETPKKKQPTDAMIGGTAPKTSQESNSETEEWAVALFDFPGQTADDLSFHKGELIRVTEHVDAEWRRGRLEGREGLYPAAFTQPHQDKPIPEQQSAGKGVAKATFDFAAESEDELTLKVGDIITQVEVLDEQWILGVVGGRRGIVPKNYISLL